ncbi:hypothetical protein AB0I60_36150 [Actinosynnema sp. NPDC050436]|uniref:hypothetical protein n=1 Tax=Actinosynnema sp. NPDC050436 TaxID=3155659 RepID=UPI00340BF194
MGEREIREIRVGVYATEEQVRELVERFTRQLCPEPEHASPCPVPWSVSVVPAEALAEDAYPELVEQYRVENG